MAEDTKEAVKRAAEEGETGAWECEEHGTEYDPECGPCKAVPHVNELLREQATKHVIQIHVPGLHYRSGSRQVQGNQQDNLASAPNLE